MNWWPVEGHSHQRGQYITPARQRGCRRDHWARADLWHRRTLRKIAQWWFTGRFLTVMSEPRRARATRSAPAWTQHRNSTFIRDEFNFYFKAFTVLRGFIWFLLEVKWQEWLKLSMLQKKKKKKKDPFNNCSLNYGSLCIRVEAFWVEKQAIR